MSKMYLTSFVGTNMVFKDGRYLVVRDVTKPNQIAYPFDLQIVTRTNNSSEIHTVQIHRMTLYKYIYIYIYIVLCVCVQVF